MSAIPPGPEPVAPLPAAPTPKDLPPVSAADVRDDVQVYGGSEGACRRMVERLQMENVGPMIEVVDRRKGIWKVTVPRKRRLPATLVIGAHHAGCTLDQLRAGALSRRLEVFQRALTSFAILEGGWVLPALDQDIVAWCRGRAGVEERHMRLLLINARRAFARSARNLAVGLAVTGLALLILPFVLPESASAGTVTGVMCFAGAAGLLLGATNKWRQWQRVN